MPLHILRRAAYQSPALTYAYSDRTLDTAGGSLSDTIAIGPEPAANQRRFIVAFVQHSAGAGATSSNLTIGGISATKQFENNDTAGNDCYSSVWTVEVPTGTTASMSCTISSSSRSMAYYYRVYSGFRGITVAAANGAAGSTNVGAGITGLSVAKGGVIMAAAHALDGGPFSTTGDLTEDNNQDLESNDWIVAASKAYAAAATGQGYDFETGGDPGAAEACCHIVLNPT